jgi:surface polysaccharide O-acyltransferase-like enzyme
LKSSKKKKGFILNHDESTIRGSFVNLLFTLVLIVLITLGAVNKTVAENLDKIAELVIGIYAISFGVWQGKRYLENRNKDNCEGPVEDQP